MINIAINGFGRIGRHTFKAARKIKSLNVVAINDLTDTKTLAHLLKYDTAYPAADFKISYDKENLIINGKKIRVYAEREPEKLPWKKHKVDVVVESTGFFRKKEEAARHIAAGAKRVIISAPAASEDIHTYLRGVNCSKYAGEQIIDMASCTTNSLAPVIKVIHETFGIEKAMITTIHSYTTDQNLQDGPHKDLRRARAAAQNIIPTTTGAAIATTKVITDLAGKFDGLAIRVPTITVSLSDFTMVVSKPVTVEMINKALIKASKTTLKNILECVSEPLVSTDFIGDSNSSVVDLELTKVVDKTLVKVIAWYDNEWAYAKRLAEMTEIVGKHI